MCHYGFWSNIWEAIKRVCQREKSESLIVSAFENYSSLRGSLGRSERFLSPPFSTHAIDAKRTTRNKKRVSSPWERFLSSNGHLKLPFCNCSNHGQMCGMINDRRMHSYMCCTASPASSFYDSISEMHDVWCDDDRKWRSSFGGWKSDV